MERAKPLTTSRIAKTAPGSNDIWLADSDAKRGFGRLLLRVSPNGARHFYFRISKSGQRTVVPLGPYSKDSRPNHLTLNQAREAAQQALALFRGGKLKSSPTVQPAEQFLSKSTTTVEPTSAASISGDSASIKTAENEGTVQELCMEYANHLRSLGKYSANDTASKIRLHLEGSELGLTPASRATAQLISAHLRTIVTAGKGRTASIVRSNISAAFNLALKSELDPSLTIDFSRFHVASNPVSNVGSLSQFSKARNRMLSSSELSHLWRLLESTVSDTASLHIADRFIRLTILLGGQRCMQLARAEISKVNLEDWTITLLDPKGARKIARTHILPISTYAREDVEWLLRFARDVQSKFLFPDNVGPGKQISDSTVGDRVRRLSMRLAKSHNVPPFSYGDFRRTSQSHMARLRIREEVVNRILSHGLGGVPNLHYNRNDYLDEMRDALEIWGKYVTSLPSP